MKGLDLMPLLKKTIHESDQILKQNPLAAHFIPPAAPALDAFNSVPWKEMDVELMQNRENPE